MRLSHFFDNKYQVPGAGLGPALPGLPSDGPLLHSELCPEHARASWEPVQLKSNIPEAFTRGVVRKKEAREAAAEATESLLVWRRTLKSP